MGVIPRRFFPRLEDSYGEYITQEESKEEALRDTGVLEDRSGRVCIKDSASFKIDNFVSGTIIAFLGTAQDGGYFEVEDF
jgi:hypothetical protein